MPLAYECFTSLRGQLLLYSQGFKGCVLQQRMNGTWQVLQFSLFVYSQLHFELPLCAVNIDVPVFTELMEETEKNPVNSLEYVTGCAKCCEERIKQVRKNGFFLSAIGSHSGEL